MTDEITKAYRELSALIDGGTKMTDWQPIETAPKDRPILVYGNKEKGDQAEFGQRIAVAVYHSEMQLISGDRPMFVYAPHRVEGDGPERCICPSHWMELPEEPQ